MSQAGIKYLIMLFTIVITLMFGMENVTSNPQQVTIAILDFKDNSPLASADLKPLQQGLADMMITTLSQVSALKVVERSQLNAMLEEMALGQSGVVDESSAQKVGKVLGAHYLVLGSFMKGFKDDIRIDCRIVQTETAVTLKADEVSGKLKNILELMNKLGQKVIKNLDIKLDSSEEKSIKKLGASCAYEVLMDYFRALDLIERKQYREADRILTKVIEQCPDFERAKYTKKEMRATFKKTVGANKSN